MTAGNMFQQKVDEIFKDMPNVFEIVNGILLIRNNSDSKDHDETL